MNQDNQQNSNVQDGDDLSQKRPYPFDQANHSSGESDAGWEDTQSSSPKRPCPDTEEMMDQGEDSFSQEDDTRALEGIDELPAIEVATPYLASRYFPGSRRLDNQKPKKERKFVLGLPHYMLQPEDAPYLGNNNPSSDAFIIEYPDNSVELLPSELLNPGASLDPEATITKLMNREINTEMMRTPNDNDHV